MGVRHFVKWPLRLFVWKWSALLLKLAGFPSLLTRYKIAKVRRDFMRGLRRVYPGLVAEELIGVQPMTKDAGQIFTMRVKNNVRD